MARIRTVKPEFFAHEGMASCSPHARLLAIALLQIADRFGRLRWVPMQVHAHAFPYEPGLDMDALAGELADVGYLALWQANGKTWAWVRNFQTHQVISGTETRNVIRTPEPPQNLKDSAWLAIGRPKDDGWQAGNKEQGTRNKEEEDFVASEAATMVADAPLLSPAQEVWEHYLSRRSRRSKMPASAAEQIRARIRSTSVESCKLVVDWSHDAPSAAHLRDNDRHRDYTRWSTIFARKNFDKYLEEAQEWHDAGRSKQAPQPSQPEPTRTYQSWSWFETELRARADELAMTPEQVTPEWARKHRDWQTVPGWVFDRALEATREARSARY